MNSFSLPDGFRSLSTLELFFSTWSSRTITVLGLVSASSSSANEVQLWDLYEQVMLCQVSLEMGEKANLLAIVEHEGFHFIVVGATFGREPELGRLRLLRFCERSNEILSLWCTSSDANQRINHLVSAAAKVLKISPTFPEDDGLPLQEDISEGCFCPRTPPQKSVDVPSSPWIVIGFKDKTFSIFSINSQENSLNEVYSWSNIASPVSHTDLLLAVTAFQSGTDIFIVTGSWDKTVRFWKFKWTKTMNGYAWKLTPAEMNDHGDGSVKIFREHKKSVTAMASHVFAVPEMLEEEQPGASSYHISKVMVTGSLDKSLIIWDLESQQAIRKLYGHTNQVLCIQIYDTKMDGLPPLVISSGKDKQLIFWNLISGEKVRVIDLPNEMPHFSVSVSDKGGLLLVGPCGSDTVVFNFDSVERIRRMKTNPVTSIDVFYPRENETNKWLKRPLVIVGAIDATCSVFDYYRGEELKHMKIAKCQAGRRVTRSSRSRTAPPSSSIRDHDANGHTDRINSAIIYAPARPAVDGSCDVLVITASGDNNIKVWRIDGTFVKTLGKHSLTTYPLTLYNPEVYTEDALLPTKYSDLCNSEDFLTDTMIISGGRDCHIKCWDLFGPGNEKTMFDIPNAHHAFIRTLAVHYPRDDPCNPILISGAYDNMVTMWNLRTRAKMHTISEHKGFIFALAIYNPYEHGIKDWEKEKSVLVSGCYDNNAITWEINRKSAMSGSSSNSSRDSNSSVEAIKKHTLSKHKESVTDLAMYTPRSPSRRPLVVTCSIDKLVMVWDLHHGICLQTLVGHTDRVCFMKIFNPPKHIEHSPPSTVPKHKHPLDFPTIISGGDDSMNIIWEDTLYEQRFMPAREMVNRAFAFDLKEDDWPMITSLAKEWEGRIFYENSHLFHLAIRHKRPDFLLKFRRYLKRVLTFIREYDTQFWILDPDDDISIHTTSTALGQQMRHSSASDTQPTLPKVETGVLHQEVCSDTSSIKSIRRRLTRRNALELTNVEEPTSAVPPRSQFGRSSSMKSAVDNAATQTINPAGDAELTVGTRRKSKHKSFVKSVREDLLDHIPNLMAAWGGYPISSKERQDHPDLNADASNSKPAPFNPTASESNRRELFKQSQSKLQARRQTALNQPLHSERSLRRAKSNTSLGANGQSNTLVIDRPTLVHQSSLEYLESRHIKNLLLHAIDQNDLVSLRVILLCWAEILNEDIQDILTQRLYHPIYFFPEENLRLLAFVYPAEFQHFIMALRLIRNEPSLLHQERARLDDTTRFEISGTHSRCCRSNLIWGDTIVSRSLSTTISEISPGSSGAHTASFSWSLVGSLILQIFENHHDGTRTSTEQPITSMLVPLKMHSDIRDLLDLFVLVAEQLNNVEIFDSDVGVMTLNYVWSYTSRSSHIVFSSVYLIFLCLHSLSVFLCETNSPSFGVLPNSIKNGTASELSKNLPVVKEEEDNFIERGRICFFVIVGLLCLYAIMQVMGMLSSTARSSTSFSWLRSLTKCALAAGIAYGMVFQWNQTSPEQRLPWLMTTGTVATFGINISVIAGFCIYGIEEFAQAFEKFKNLSVNSLLLHFVFDIWNFLDAVIIICGISGQILHIVFWSDSSVGRGFIALTAVLMWCKLLYYLRPFSRSGPLVVMITTIVFDIRNLLIVLVFVLCGFAQAFWLISQGDHNEHFKDMDVALYNALLYMLGQNIAPDQIQSVFGKCLLIAFMLVMTLLLLNLLIALMGDTFSSVRDQGVARWRKEQASIILDNRFDASNFELTTEVPDLLFPASIRSSMERVLRWVESILPISIKSLLSKHQHPPYLHVLKYSAEVRSQPRIGYKKLRRLVTLSRSQVLPFEDFKLTRSTTPNGTGERDSDSDDWEDDADLDEKL